MRIALGIEYNGQGFYGWQKQDNLPTVQGCLEIALSQIADEPIQVFCAGRTDAGVHAAGQVVHFETQARRDPRAWVSGTNTYLPTATAVCWSYEVDDEFHARYSALSRCYQYIIDRRPVRPALLAGKVTWHYGPLNIAAMQEAGNYLIGEHNFSAFRSSECESKSPVRHLQSLTVICSHDYIVIQVRANAFLHHMVRNIVGTLLKIGAGLEKPVWARQVLDSQDRKKAGATAPAAGLYLTQVDYPSRYVFPRGEIGYNRKLF
jgi:tRNA pseudouridine38-40 synthase